MKRVSFHTLGCKLNFAETSTFKRQFVDLGYSFVDFSTPADVVLINTCSVTENADKDARKAVRRALKLSPDARVIVVGCYAQLRPEEVASIPGVYLVLGNEEKFHISDYLHRESDADDVRIAVGDIAETTDFGVAFSAEHSGRTRAFLKVQDGCDYNCTYCTIPMARGRSRSESIERTIEHSSHILSQGFREIVLSGVNVGDYGAGQSATLYELLVRLLDLPGDFRIRISSIEPNLLDDDIIALAASTERLCSHFHIPLQSGSDVVLRRMRRRYNTAMYAERIEAVLAAMPNAGIGVDVIVGTPGETAEQFRESYEYLVNLPCSYLHVFNYSDRPGTIAANMVEKVPHAERAERSAMLRMLDRRKRRTFMEQQIGRVLKVLFEEERNGTVSGFSENYSRVVVLPQTGLSNAILPVSVTEMRSNTLFGSLVERPTASSGNMGLPVLT